MVLTGDPLNDIAAPIEELSESFNSMPVFNIGPWAISQYTFWMFICLALVLIVVLVAAKRVTLVPKSKFASMVEYGYDAVRRNMGEGAIGHGYEKHMPFLATLFFFILLSNVVGLIPGCKTPTGTLGVTWALALCSFVYFNYYGIKAKGGWGYIKSIAPHGLPKPMVPVIWFFEFFSLVIRLLTLAVRLYGNMLAGHMVLAVFAIATTTFVQYTFFQMGGVATGLTAFVWFFLLLFMYALETLVAFLQAYVFTILTSSYIGLAIHPH